MGWYGLTKDHTHEDVALLLLRRLLAGSHRQIKDFHYHNMCLYEDRISFLEAQNFDLIMENALLKEELRSAQWKMTP